MQRLGKSHLRGQTRVGAHILGQTIGNALAYQISQGSNSADQANNAPKAGATYEQNLAAHGFTFGDGGLTATPTDNTMYAPDPSLAGAQTGDIVVTATRRPTYVDGYLLNSFDFSLASQGLGGSGSLSLQDTGWLGSDTWKRGYLGTTVTLPNGNYIPDPYSPTGYLMSPNSNLQVVANAGREIGNNFINMINDPYSSEGALPAMVGSIEADLGHGGVFDYQRDGGNSITGWVQRPQFRDVSNFNVGLLMQQTGQFSMEDTLRIAGGFAGVMSNNSNSNQPYGLSPQTAYWIKAGYSAGLTGLYGKPAGR